MNDVEKTGGFDVAQLLKKGVGSVPPELNEKIREYLCARAIRIWIVVLISMGIPPTPVRKQAVLRDRDQRSHYFSRLKFLISRAESEGRGALPLARSSIDSEINALSKVDGLAAINVLAGSGHKVDEAGIVYRESVKGQPKVGGNDDGDESCAASDAYASALKQALGRMPVTLAALIDAALPASERTASAKKKAEVLHKKFEGVDGFLGKDSLVSLIKATEAGDKEAFICTVQRIR